MESTEAFLKYPIREAGRQLTYYFTFLLDITAFSLHGNDISFFKIVLTSRTDIFVETSGIGSMVDILVKTAGIGSIGIDIRNDIKDRHHSIASVFTSGITA